MKHFFLTLILAIGSSLTFAQSEFWGVNSSGGANAWGTIYKMDFDGSNYTVMHNFDFTYGGTPMGNLVKASDGNLYGTCFDGGSWASCTIYRIDPTSGVFTHLWDFDIATGDFPMGGMVDYNNKVYGCSWSGGTGGAGVIYYWDYVLNSYGTVHDFNGTDGSSLIGEPLLVGTKLYGTASGGGSFAAGTLFEFDIPTSSFGTLHEFNGTEGSAPEGGLILADDGKLYGMTKQGGTADDGGVLYSYDPSGSTFEVLYEFDPAAGYGPRGKLLEGSDGLLYGLTASQTASNGHLFSFDRSTGNITWLHSFSSTDGSTPYGDLAEFGNTLYGVTYAGGATNDGVHFKYDLISGTYTKTRDLDASTGTKPMYGNYILLGVDPSKIEEQHISSVRLYPTVSDGNINLSDFTSGTLQVTDLSGKVFFSSALTGPATSIDLELSAGAYLWHFEDGVSQRSGKLVIR